MSTLAPTLGPVAIRAPRPWRGPFAAFTRDPRHYQITVQSALLAGGVVFLDFEIGAARALFSIAATLGAQWLCTRFAAYVAALRGRPAMPFEWKSAFISGLGLGLLLRTSSPLLVLAAALLAIGSKFVIRWKGKHLFNPTCFALVTLMAMTPHVWVSPGQWGHATIAAFAIACLGSVVVTRAARADTSFGFLAAWAAVLFGRALWLGQPWSAPAHVLTNGAVLLFAFFMISDPRTTPDSRAGRLLFVTLVALGAGFVQFVLFRTNGLLWSLAACAPLVPLIDHWLPGARHHWTTEARTSRTTKGTTDVASPAPVHA